MFAEEAEGRLATLSELLLELERDGGNQELLSSIFREAHTLKGGAAVVGLDDVMRVAHAMEEVLEGLRGGGATATQGLVDALLGAVDGIRELLPAVLAGEDRAAEAGALVVALQAPAPDTQPPPAPPPAVSDPPSAVPAPPPTTVPSPDPPPAALPPPVRRGRRKTIRLPTERLDELVRLAGEASAAALRVGRLVTDQLGAEPAGVPELHELTRALESLQERTLQARMVPFGTIAEPLRRAVRDLAARSASRSSWSCAARRPSSTAASSSRSPTRSSTWSATPSTTASSRPRRGWPPASRPGGTVAVHAMQLGSEVVVTVADDGRGIDLERVRERAGASGDSLAGVDDAEALYAIFRSGLSTAATVSEVSGRGVGLDVVRSSLAAVRGRVEVHSEPGAGSEFRLSVPITLALLPCLLVTAAGRR